MKMKKLFAMSAIAFLIGVSSAFALGMTGGPVKILANVGDSNSSSYGLINSGSETITVKIRVEGDAAQFVEVPETLDLVPNELTDVDVTATIPSDYDGSLGGNITGFIYAVQEGSPGQVQINVQAKKVVQVLIPEYGGSLVAEKTQQQLQTGSTEAAGNALTAFASLPALDFNLVGAVVAGIVIFLAFVFVSRRFSFRQAETKVKPQRKRR